MNTAAFIYGARDIRIDSIAQPEPAANQTVVEIESVGICGSDLHYYKDGGIGAATIDKPFVPGHEFSARLTEDIADANLQSGQLVAVDPATPCLQCEWCIKGYHNLCPRVEFIGAPPFNGALTQSLSVPLANLVQLPSSITADQAAMLEPLGVCIHAMDLAKPQLLESVALLGCGPIGLGVLQLLKIMTCRSVYAVDPLEHRSILAASLGADAVGGSTDVVLDNSRGQGCDIVIEATNSPAGLSDAIRACKIGGRIILVGIPDGDDYAVIKSSEARRKGLTILFSRRMGQVYPRAIELVHNNLVDVDALISHRFDLSDTPTAFAMQAAGEDGLVKSMVYPNR